METFLFLTTYRNSQNRLTFMAYNDYESFLLLLKNNLPAKLFLIANNFETTEQWICLKCKLFGLFTQLLNHMFFSCYIYRLRVNEKKRQIGHLRYINIPACMAPRHSGQNCKLSFFCPSIPNRD